MADNVPLNPGAGPVTAGADDIAGVHYQRVKIIHGADGVNDGDVSTASPMPVDLRANNLAALEVVGDIAHDAAAGSVNPVLGGLFARTNNMTVVAEDDLVRALATLHGKAVTLPFALPADTWSYVAASGGIINDTGVTAKAAAGVGIYNYVTSLQVINGHQTVGTDVQIRDGAAGTVIWRGWAQQAGGGVSLQFATPLKGTANTLLEVQCGTTGAQVYFNLQGYVAAE